MAKKTPAERKAKIRQRGENAIRRGNQYRAKRLRARYDRIDTNPVSSVSSQKIPYTSSSSYDQNNSAKFANEGMPNLTYEDKFGTYDNASDTAFKNPEKILSNISPKLNFAKTINPLSGIKHTETVVEPGDYVSRTISAREGNKIDLLEDQYYSNKSRRELRQIKKAKENNIIGDYSRFDALRKLTSPERIQTGSTITYRIN